MIKSDSYAMEYTTDSTVKDSLDKDMQHEHVGDYHTKIDKEDHCEKLKIDGNKIDRTEHVHSHHDHVARSKSQINKNAILQPSKRKGAHDATFPDRADAVVYDDCGIEISKPCSSESQPSTIKLEKVNSQEHDQDVKPCNESNVKKGAVQPVEQSSIRGEQEIKSKLNSKSASKKVVAISHAMSKTKSNNSSHGDAIHLLEESDASEKSGTSANPVDDASSSTQDLEGSSQDKSQFPSKDHHHKIENKEHVSTYPLSDSFNIDSESDIQSELISQDDDHSNSIHASSHTSPVLIHDTSFSHTLYFRLMEYQDASNLHANYFFAHCYFDKLKVWCSPKVKQPIWSQPGSMLSIPSDVTTFKLVLYKSKLFKFYLGEVEWKLESLSTNYPHYQWFPVNHINNSQPQGQVKVQMQYLNQVKDFDLSVFDQPINFFIKNNKFEYFQETLKKPESIMSAQGFNESPIHVALQCGNLQYIKPLLDLNSKKLNGAVSPTGENCIHVAAQYIRTDNHAINQLVQHGYSVDALTKDSKTPMHYAAIYNNPHAINQLAKAGAQLNSQDAEKNTPLHLALMNDSLLAIPALIKNGASINKCNNLGLPLYELVNDIEAVSLSACKALTDALECDTPRQLKFIEKFPIIYRSLEPSPHGNICKFNYLESTQCALSAKTKTTVQVLFTFSKLKSKSKSMPKTGFVLVDSDQGQHYLPTLRENLISVAGDRPFHLTLHPNKFTFVVPYLKKKSSNLACRLIVMAPKEKIVQVHYPSPWKFNLVQHGSWGDGTAGGTMPNDNWTENPRFLFSMPAKKELTFAVSLSQKLPNQELMYVDQLFEQPISNSIGFYIMDSKCKRILNKTPKWVYSVETHIIATMDFDEDKLVTIIPCYFSPGQKGDFTLRVYCDEPIGLQKAN